LDPADPVERPRQREPGALEQELPRKQCPVQVTGREHALGHPMTLSDGARRAPAGPPDPERILTSASGSFHSCRRGSRHVDPDPGGDITMIGTRMVGFAAALVLAAGAAGALPATAYADERVCRGVIGARTLDNVRVPTGATCRLTRTFVKGTITVQRGATLVATRVRVVGNVQAEGARNVVVRRASRVGGSVQVKQGGAASVLESRVTGDIQYDANRGTLRANWNRVGGSIQVVGNRARALIFRNVVNGNLQCKENSPRPLGNRNRVGGTKEDQCRRF
jgi:hypothetical protein